MKYGVDYSNVSERCGCRPNARQIQDTVDCDSPIFLAVGRMDQWVAFPPGYLKRFPD